jgi:hypothetical protein
MAKIPDAEPKQKLIGEKDLYLRFLWLNGITEKSQQEKWWERERRKRVLLAGSQAHRGST